jgi:hypothetical protein
MKCANGWNTEKIISKVITEHDRELVIKMDELEVSTFYQCSVRIGIKTSSKTSDEYSPWSKELNVPTKNSKIEKVK